MEPGGLLRSALWTLLALWLPAPSCGASVAPSPAVRVEGIGFPSNAFNLNALFAYSFVQPNVQMTLNILINGDGAMCRLMNATRECAATDTAQPRTLDWASTLNPPAASAYLRYPDLQLYPTAANAVVFVYNLNGISNLVLSMQIASKIFSGRITTWDHPDILATNPNFAAWNIPKNQSIKVVAQIENSGSTVNLRKALAGADPTFVAAANWGGLVKPVATLGSGTPLVSYVNQNPYTIGYTASQSSIGVAPMARLNRSGTVIEPTIASVQYAVLEKGLSFGNNGDDPAHLTGDLLNAYNPLAWPIVAYTYVGVRKDTLRPGSSCAVVAAMVDYWLWFWNADAVAQLGAPLGFSVLPEVVRDFVVTRFKADMRCNGSLVWQDPVVPVIAGYGTETAQPIFEKFQQAYALVNSSVSLNYTILANEQADVTQQLQAGGFLVSTSPSAVSGVYNLVLGGVAVIAVSPLAGVTLNVLTLAKILNGDITTWLHPDIVALNPNGLTLSGVVVKNNSQPIVLLQGPIATSAPLAALLRRYYPVYTGAAIQAAARYPREMLLWSAVVGIPYAFSVTAMVGQFPAELQMAALVTGGVAVAPSLATATATTVGATYDPATQSITLAPPANSSSWPLLLPLYVSVQRQCPSPPAMAQTVTFLQWMFTPRTLAAALNALGLVSLAGVSTAIQAANDDTLFELSCQVRPVPEVPTDMVPLLLGIIIPIAVVVLLGLGACGWWLWRVTEYNRMLRKKFSNDNVAESCAEAIARFDLQAVAWLKEVKEPNKIQLAFLAIIGLLTEVKPYIPDQLLSQLTVSKSEGSEEDVAGGDAEHQSERSSLAPRNATRQSLCESPQPKRLHQLHGLASPSARSAASSHRVGNRGHRGTIASTDGVKQVLAMKDWRHKRCTYMCVRFGSGYHHAEQRLYQLTEIVGHIVDVAKANGATIDSVGVDFVTVHWGVASNSTVSAARAIQAGMEISKLRDLLPEEHQAEFWLQMGIGKGVSDCGTVSAPASGHRFFVVWGLEASLAVEIAATNLPKRVLCSLLVSAAVYQEVQYTVQ
eukprot:EG_transcript_1645